MKAKFEPFAHGASMLGLKAGAAVMPLPWPKPFEGQNPSLDLCRYIIKQKRKSLLFVTSKTPVRTGLVQPLIDELEAGGVKVTLFDQIKPDPTVEIIESVVTILKDNQCDSVLALGGGSCIDAAKVIAARGKNKKSILKMAGLFRVTKGMLPLYAVPTTAGTGSEVTTAAVVLDPVGERKLAVVDPRLMPRAAALDGKLMLGVPQHTTAITGIDALTHAVEAFVSRNALRRTDKMAIEAVQLIMANLETAYADGSNVEARQNMARASHLAGKAFTQVGLGYVHAIAHKFGALYHTPHGRANAIVMPHVLDYSLPKCAGRLAKLARASNIGTEDQSKEERAKLFIARIRELNESFGIPSQLVDLKAEDIPRIAKAAREEARFTYAVPRYMNRKNCEDVIAKMLVA
jgi:alcohol dehydrogenase class IV